ncbi:MAG: acyl-CoA dehydrogenase family protein [Alphaproteobacteria bacterium]|nr:acyl-CoA dehydrogenase family protein [Alphaproteobacteria bacterium]
MTGATQRAHGLLSEIRAARAGMDEARQLPADLADRFREEGLFRLCVPRAYGGEEVDPLTLVSTLEALAGADASAAWCVMIAATTGSLAAYLLPDEARTIFDDPNAVMTGAYAPTGRARVTAKGFEVSGRWKWNSAGRNSTWLCAGCVLESQAGDPASPPRTRLMIFPANEATFIDTWRTSGLRGTGSGDFEVDQLNVPQARSVSLVEDEPVCPGPLYAFPIFGLLAMGIAAVASGNALEALEEFRAVARSKRLPGGRTLAERGAMQVLFAEAYADVHSARAFFLQEIASAWSSANSDEPISTDQKARLRLSATHLVRTAALVCRRLQDAAGGGSVFLDDPLNRRSLDAQTMTAHIMIAPSTCELTGRALMGLPVSALEL